MEIKIVCLNLWEGGILFPDIIDFLREQDADIVMLQEVCVHKTGVLPDQFHSLEVLDRELAYPYVEFVPAMLDLVPEGTFENGNAVLSRFPLRPKSAVFFKEPYRERVHHDIAEAPTTPRNLQHVVADVNGTELNIFNFQGVWTWTGTIIVPNGSIWRKSSSTQYKGCHMSCWQVTLTPKPSTKPC